MLDTISLKYKSKHTQNYYDVQLSTKYENQETIQYN
jgi:hypothetical protein